MGLLQKAASTAASAHAKTNLGTWAAKKNPKVAELEKKVSKYNGGMGFKDPSQSINEMVADPKKFSSQWSEIFGFGGTQNGAKSGPLGKPLGLNGQEIKLSAYKGLTDEEGNLLGKYKLGNASPWLGQQLQMEQLTRGQNMDNASRNTLSGVGQMQSQLAMNGGLSSGSRERIAKQGARDLNLARQGVNLQGDLNRLSLESDAFDKNQEANKYNIQNLIGDQKALEDRKLMRYQTDMSTWAAGKQGDAIAKSGKK